MATGIPPSCSFLVTINRHSDDVIGHVTQNFCIANEGDSEQEAESRQNLKSIEICFNSSHRVKIALYLDRIHQYLCPVKFL